MRLLMTIVHYYDPEGGGKHASLRPDPRPRLAALAQTINALRNHYGPQQAILDIADRTARPANRHAATTKIDVVICTTRGKHLLGQLQLPDGAITHRETNAEPKLLGYECQAVLCDALGHYDFYGYLEDDLILHDPGFFQKLSWFNRHTPMESLLLPNRFELAPPRAAIPARKVYIDGDINPKATNRFQDISTDPSVELPYLDRAVAFVRPTNPHSGCYFLSNDQLSHWVAKDYFLDRATDFIGPLESAATLGIMRAFKVYKPHRDHARFLEIEHHGTGFLGLIGRGIAVAPDMVPALQSG